MVFANVLLELEHGV